MNKYRTIAGASILTAVGLAAVVGYTEYQKAQRSTASRPHEEKLEKSLENIADMAKEMGENMQQMIQTEQTLNHVESIVSPNYEYNSSHPDEYTATEQARPSLEDYLSQMQIHPDALPQPRMHDWLTGEQQEDLRRIHSIYTLTLSANGPNPEYTQFIDELVQFNSYSEFRVQRWALAFTSHVLTQGQLTLDQRKSLEDKLIEVSLIDPNKQAKLLAAKIIEEAEGTYGNREEIMGTISDATKKANGRE